MANCILKVLLLILVSYGASYGQIEGYEKFKTIFKENKDKIVRVNSESSVGSGFITKDGYIVTANHVIGTSVLVKMSYQNVTYYLKAFYRDHANDIAILYPYSYVNYQGKNENINHDFLKGRSQFAFKKLDLKTDEKIMVLGYPYGLLDLKRIYGLYKREVTRYMESVPLYECDLPVIKGCSGGPVFNEEGEIIGIAVRYESRPTGTDYLSTYVSPGKNIEKILQKNHGDKINTIRRLYNDIPSFSINSANLMKLDTSLISLYNMKDVGKKSILLVNKSGSSSGHFMYNKSSIKAVNIFFNLYMEKSNSDSDEDSLFELIIKKQDENNYISFNVNLSQNQYYFIYMVNGVKSIKRAEIDMPVIAETFYNIEVYCRGKEVGVYFDNIAIYTDKDLPFDAGECGFKFQNQKSIYIDTLYLRIPRYF